MEHKLREIEQSMEERWRRLEARVESIDRRAGKGRGKTLAGKQDGRIPVASGGSTASEHVSALEACLEAALESLFPHVEALLSELERRIPAESTRSSPFLPESSGSTAQASSATPVNTDSGTDHRIPPPSPIPSPRKSILRKPDVFVDKTNTTVPFDTKSISSSNNKSLISSGSLKDKVSVTPETGNALSTSSVQNEISAVPAENMSPPEVHTSSSPDSQTNMVLSSHVSSITSSTDKKIGSSHDNTSTSKMSTSDVASPDTSTLDESMSSTSIPKSELQKSLFSERKESTDYNPFAPFDNEPFLASVLSKASVASKTRATEHSTPSPSTSASRVSIPATSSLTNSRLSTDETSLPAMNVSSAYDHSKQALNPSTGSETDSVAEQTSSSRLSDTTSTPSIVSSQPHKATKVTFNEPVSTTFPETSTLDVAPPRKADGTKSSVPPPVPPRQRSVLTSSQGPPNSLTKPYIISSLDRPTSHLSTEVSSRKFSPAADEVPVQIDGSLVSTEAAEKEPFLRVKSSPTSISRSSTCMNQTTFTTTTVTSSRWSLSSISQTPHASTSSSTSTRPISCHNPSVSTQPNIHSAPTASQSPHLPSSQIPVSSSSSPSVAHPSTVTTTTTTSHPAPSDSTNPTASSSIQPSASPPKSSFFPPVSKTRTSSIGEEMSLPAGTFPSLDGMTPLLKAAKYGETKDVLAALRKDIDIDGGDTFGQTALHWAAWRGHHEILSLLLKSGARVNGIRNTHELTPLHLAAATGHAQCVAFLVEAGVDVDCRSKLRRTPLHMAAIDGHEAVVQVLLAAGAEATAQDSNGRTPLSVALTHAIRELMLR